MRSIIFLLTILVVLGTVAVDAAADTLPSTLTLDFTEFSNTDLAVSVQGGSQIHFSSAGDSWSVPYLSLFQCQGCSPLIPGSIPNIGEWNEADGSLNKVIRGPANSMMLITSEAGAGAAIPVANGVSVQFVDAIDEQTSVFGIFIHHDISITFNDLGDTGLVGVPEPSTLSLLAVGLAGLGYRIRRRRR